MYNEQLGYSGETCLEHALKLLIKVGHLSEPVINRIIKEENYEKLFGVLEICRSKQNSKAISFNSENIYTKFDARICLAEALLCLIDIGQLKIDELISKIEQDGYPGVYKILDRQIRQDNSLSFVESETIYSSLYTSQTGELRK